MSDGTSDADRPPTDAGPVRGWRRAAVAVSVVALILAALTVVAATGDDKGSGGTSAPADSSADAGFARDMIVHHQQAVEMAFIVRDRTDDEDVRRLAYDIANTQANQRGMLLGWLDLWGLSKTSAAPPMEWMGGGHAGHQAQGGALMPGMATDAQIDSLDKASSKKAEISFLRLMIAHHQGGVEMAQGCVQECGTRKERTFAQGIVDSQKSEITLMEGMLKKRGATS